MTTFARVVPTLSSLVLALSSVCAGEAPPNRGGNAGRAPDACTPVCEDNFTVTSGGIDRSLILQVPAVYDGHEPLPLLLVLHGFGGASQSLCASPNGFYCKAEAEGLIVAYLNGTPCDPHFGDPGCNPSAPGRGWNSGLTPSLGITVDDVQFVRDVLEQVGAEVRIDPRRVYAAGFSNGAMMSYLLAAKLPDLLAGVALAEGTMGRDPEGDGSFLTIPAADGPVPILVMHGTADQAIGYDGNTGYLCPCKSVASAVSSWVESNDCRGPATSVREGDIITSSFAGCYANDDVVLITIEDGEHVWPSIGTDAAWGFLSKHSLTGR